jgi:type III secretion system chaperone SycN
VSENRQILAELGRSLGMNELSWPANGVVALEFERRGTLFLEDAGDVLLVYLARGIDIGADKAGILRNALRLCHYRQGASYQVQAGLRGDSTLVFLVRLAASQIALPEIEHVLELLSRLQDTARA